MTCLTLVAIENQLRLYGTSSSPTRQRGTFDCLVGDQRFEGIDLFEGHSNSVFEHLRLLTVCCSSVSWKLDAALTLLLTGQKRDILFEVKGEKCGVTFHMQRFSAEIRATIKQCDVPRGQEYAGLILCNGQERGTVRIFVPDDSSECLDPVSKPS